MNKKYTDLKLASLSTLKQEKVYLGVIRNKQYLNTGEESVSFRMSEFWGIVLPGEYDAYTLLDRVNEIIKRFEKLGVLKDVEFGEPAMQHTVFLGQIDGNVLDEYFSAVEEEIKHRESPEEKPILDDTGKLTFRGQSISFIGQERKLMRYLLECSGTLVEKEEVFKAIYEKDYIAEEKKFGKTPALEPLEALYKALKKKIV